MAENKPARLDKDLDRLARAAGRPTLAGALATAFAVGSTVAIDRLYGGEPTLLAYVAVGVLLWFVCPALVVAALRHRRAMHEWAQAQQKQREEARPRRRKTETGKIQALCENLEDRPRPPRGKGGS